MYGSPSGPLGPVGPVYASPSAVIQLITPEQVYANGLTCPEFQQMNLTTPNAVVNDTGCCDAFAYCLDNAQCSSLMTLFQVALIAVLVYCASKYAEAQSRSVFAGGEWLPGIIVPAMFTFFLYVVSLSVHAGSLGCCICCFGRTASLTLVQTGPGGNAIGNPTRANQVPNAIVGSGPRRHGCCEIPSALISSVFTEPATETAAVAHFDKMRTAPMRLLIKVRCGHWVRRGKHSHFVVTYTAEIPYSITAARDYSNTADQVSAALRAASGDSILAEFDSAYDASPHSLDIINSTRTHFENQYRQFDSTVEIGVEYMTASSPRSGLWSSNAHPAARALRAALPPRAACASRL